MTRRSLGLLAIGALGLTYASLPQGIGWNQNANYALTRALANGTAIVDPYRDETGDVAWVDGHYYSTKPPGLAFLSLPVYLGLEQSGALDLLEHLPGLEDADVAVLWIMGLVGSVLPGALVLLLVRTLGETVVPGYGTVAAVVLGAGTLFLPFSTLFFGHVLSAALGFAAFAVLWLERERGVGVRPMVAGEAGVLAGLAVVAHYTLAIVALIVGVYVLATRPRARGVLSYAGGLLVGLAPLVAYNWLAFGSPTHLSYRDAVRIGGASGHDLLGANASGFFGIGTPNATAAADLLFGSIGLVTLAPVVGAGAAGIALLYRRRRAEASVAGAVVLTFLLLNSGYVDPFGGFTPGPRFLIPVLPFFGVPLALAVRRFPLPSLVLAAISIMLMVAVTITQPLLAYDGRWLERVENGSFGGHGLYPMLPFLLLVACAVALAAVATPRPALFLSGVAAGLAAAGGWLVLFLAAPGVRGDLVADRLVAATEVLAAAMLVCALAVGAHVIAGPTSRPQAAMHVTPSRAARE